MVNFDQVLHQRPLAIQKIRTDEDCLLVLRPGCDERPDCDETPLKWLMTPRHPDLGRGPCSFAVGFLVFAFCLV